MFVSESISVRCFVRPSQRKVAHIDMCCRTLQTFEQLGCVIVSGRKHGNCAAPTVTHFDLSTSLHWSSISFVWRLLGALSRLIANG